MISERLHAEEAVENRQKTESDRRIMAEKSSRPDGLEVLRRELANPEVALDVEMVVPLEVEVERFAVDGESDAQQQRVGQNALPALEFFRESKERENGVPRITRFWNARRLSRPERIGSVLARSL